ncbi:glycosyltransferase family 2 protein [Fluviicola sp.]|uniref:glycosyltransferase family 2 protein n=1 Tax=Fluviicola sp. TaxID=1917219 RepID=UPI003D2BDD67
MTRISVIIPTFDRGDIFDECIQSVIESIGYQDEIIVINDSKKHSPQLKTEDSRLRVFDNTKNGVASARNLGASYATGEYLLFIDDDMLINSDAIESCYQLIIKKPEAAINADWVYNPVELKKNRASSFGRYLDHTQFTSLRGWCTNLQWIENGLVQAKGITSQFLLISRKIFTLTKGYNESFPFAGFEDYDFGKRLETLGIEFIINTQCCVYHNEKDRMQLKPFIERKKRGAFTRKKGVEIGYSELAIPFNFFKKKYLQCSIIFKPIYTFLINITPNSKAADPFYRFLVNRLVGIAIYEGYSQKKIL